METRLLVAYALILLLVLAASGGIFHLSRGWRAARRGEASARKRRKERRLAEAKA